MAVKRKIQLSQLTEEAKNADMGMMNNPDGIAALARLVKYCEAEASDLKLSFVAYCLSIANVALAEEVSVPEIQDPAKEA